MVGQNSKIVDEDVNMNRYHGKRRNATANINRQWDSGSSGQGSNRINRVNANPIYSRISTHTKSSFPKKDMRWKSGDQTRATTSDNRSKSESDTRGYPNNRYRYNKKQNKEIYSTIQSVGRLKISPKSYKIGDEVKELKPSQTFCKLVNMEQSVFDLIVQFMQQYFTCFDKNRDELLAAYHRKALFSASFNLKGPAITGRRSARFGSYVKESRNQLYVKDEVRTHQMLHRTNLDIVAWLKKLPETEHVSSSFKLDSFHYQPNILSFSISGVYKEKRPAEERLSCYRSFMRTFVCAPVSSDQMIIVNEQCVISNLSIQQAKVYKDERMEAEMVASASSTVEPTLSEADMKKEMIKKFSDMSGLSIKWANDCLEFSEWNFSVAEKNFHEHKNEIPPEAFMQNTMNSI